MIAIAVADFDVGVVAIVVAMLAAGELESVAIFAAMTLTAESSLD